MQIPSTIASYIESNTSHQPLYLYDSHAIRQQCQTLLSLKNIRTRYALKANPHPDVLQLIHDGWIWIDACSEEEALFCLAQWIPGEHIQIVSQQCPRQRETLANNNIMFVACSLHQLEQFCLHSPQQTFWIRLNPWVWSWAFAQVNVWWAQSSFGIWHEYLDDARAIAAKHNKTITTLHTHIWSWTDLDIWSWVIDLSLSFVDRLADVTTLDLWGGFKVWRMPGEHSTDMIAIGEIINKKVSDYHTRTGRHLQIEIEPWTYVVANAWYLVAQVDDIVDTGADGYHFIKLNTGMSDILRPMLYGAQHPITLLNNSQTQKDYIVVWHSCEGADLFTPAPWQPDIVATRRLPEAHIGDTVVIGWAWAYCASMRAIWYNGFDGAQEVLV